MREARAPRVTLDFGLWTLDFKMRPDDRSNSKRGGNFGGRDRWPQASATTFRAPGSFFQSGARSLFGLLRTPIDVAKFERVLPPNPEGVTGGGDRFDDWQTGGAATAAPKTFQSSRPRRAGADFRSCCQRSAAGRGGVQDLHRALLRCAARSFGRAARWPVRLLLSFGGQGCYGWIGGDGVCADFRLGDGAFGDAGVCVVGHHHAGERALSQTIFGTQPLRSGECRWRAAGILGGVGDSGVEEGRVGRLPAEPAVCAADSVDMAVKRAFLASRISLWGSCFPGVGF